MKNIIAIVISLFLLGVAFSQPVGPIAPNFTLNDIDGNSHTLYDYLADDKIVILDFFTTWCAPCITSVPHLEEIYKQRGPNGDRTYQILSLEVDMGTSDENQFRTNLGVESPIFDNGHTIDALYGITAYPTFFVICPDSSWQILVAGGGLQSDTTLTSIGNVCGVTSNVLNDVRLMELQIEDPFICPNEPSLPAKIVVQNIGNNDLTSLQLNYSANGNSIGTSNWNGLINKFDTAHINVNGFTGLNFADYTLGISTVLPNGMADENSLKDSLEANVTATTLIAETLQVKIKLDSFGNQNQWEVRTDNGSLIQSGGPYMVNSTQTITHIVPLAANTCYSFKLFDSAGNGLIGNGSCQLLNKFGIEIVQNPSFGFEWHVGFHSHLLTDIGDKFSNNKIAIYPNPANNQFSILGVDIVEELAIYDGKGRLVKQSYITQNIDVGDLPNGLYYVKINEENSFFTKLVIAR